MTFIDDLIQKVQAQSEHGEPEAASPINLALEIFAGTALEGDIAAIGDLVTAIQNGDLTQFLSQNEIGSAEVEAIGRLIDAISAPADKSRQDRLKREAAGITIEAPKADLLKQQLGEAAATSTGSIVTSKEYRSPKAAYDALIKEIREVNDGEVPEGTPTFDEWLRLNRITSSAVIPKGTSLTMTPYKTYVGKTGDTFRSIAEAQGVDLAELMKINGVTDPEASATGAKLLVPAPKAHSPTGGRGEQTQPESQPGYDPSKPSTEPGDPGYTPGGDGLPTGDAEAGDPYLNSLFEESIGGDKLARLVDYLITDKNYTPGTAGRYERLLRKHAGLLQFGLSMDPADATTGLGTAIADLMGQIENGQGIDAWALINQAAAGDPEYRAQFEAPGMSPSSVAGILAAARSGMVPDEALSALYGGDYITGLYNDWERANQGQTDVGTFLAYLLSKGL